MTERHSFSSSKPEDNNASKSVDELHKEKMSTQITGFFVMNSPTMQTGDFGGDIVDLISFKEHLTLVNIFAYNMSGRTTGAFQMYAYTEKTRLQSETVEFEIEDGEHEGSVDCKLKCGPGNMIAFAVSIELPPPKPIMRSGLNSLHISAPFKTVSSRGSGST